MAIMVVLRWSAYIHPQLVRVMYAVPVAVKPSFWGVWHTDQARAF